MTIRGVSRRTVIDRKKAESILLPVAAFLHGRGLGKKEAAHIFSSAYEQAAKKLHVRGIEYVGHPTLYADVIALWTRDSRFLDKSGRPSELPLSGKNSFSSLVRQISADANPRIVLSVLMRCGTIKRIKQAKYSLIVPFFKTDAPKNMAFEPIAYFLSDASVTLGRMLTKKVPPRTPAPFWRKVETSNLSDSLARKFSVFARERTLTFLEELDDWLDAHKVKTSNGKVRRRVGIGVFSIYSEPETIGSAR